MDVNEGMDQILAFIQLLGLIFFYLLTAITIVRLTINSKFTIKRPFYLFRITGLILILMLLGGIAFYLMNTSDVWFKLFLISLFSSLFPLFTLFFSSLIFDFFNPQTIRNVAKLATGGALACMFAFLINQSFYFIIPSALFIVLPLLIAPVIEECLKFIIIYVFKSNGSKFGGYPSIILSAFAIGAGFAFIENFVMFTVSASPLTLGISAWLGIILSRTYVTATGHTFFVLLTLLGFEHKLFDSKWNALLVAILFHVVFNALGLFYSNLFAKEILIGFASLVLLIKLLELSKRQKSSVTKVLKVN